MDKLVNSAETEADFLLRKGEYPEAEKTALEKQAERTAKAWQPPTLDDKIQTLAEKLAKQIDEEIKDLYLKHYRRNVVIERVVYRDKIVDREIIVYKKKPSLWLRFKTWLKRPGAWRGEST